MIKDSSLPTSTMVRKEDLSNWFQNLHPRKRLDYMCSLLHMCLPLELRFIGTVLEDLAKKDFQHLRDAEIKANHRSDLSNNPTNNIDDAHLRNKITIALALMNSTNSSCAEIIYKILESQVDDLLQLVRHKTVADQISMILTMCVYHPAFKFHQRDRLGNILQTVLSRIRELFGDEDEPDLQIKQAHHQESHVHNSTAPCPSSPSPMQSAEKVIISFIRVVSSREDQSGRSKGKNQREESSSRKCPEFEVQTTWSNGEVTQIYMKYKQLQDLHHRILYTFPEEKDKKQRSIPVFPGQTFRAEPLNVQIESLNSYLSHLTKAPDHIVNCESLHKALRNGKVIQPPTPVQLPLQPAIKSSSPITSQSGQQMIFSQASLLQEDNHSQMVSSHNRSSICDNPAILTGSICSSEPSQLSSSTNSPSNSRTSSPAPQHMSPVAGKVKISSPTLAGKGQVGTENALVPHHHGPNIELSLSQFLLLLNMENYTDNLKEFSFKQILSMSIEDFSKAGLPQEAQEKLRRSLEKLKLPGLSGRNGFVKHHSVPQLVSQPMPQLQPALPIVEGPPATPSAFTFPYILPYPFPSHPTQFLQYQHLPNSVNQQQPQPQQQLATLMASPMTSSQLQQDLPPSPEFANSEASSPPTSPQLCQESHHHHHQQQQGLNSNGGSTDSSNNGHTVASSMLPYESSSPSSSSNHTVVHSGGNSCDGYQQASTPLPMMSPPAAVAADTLAHADVKHLKAKQTLKAQNLIESGMEDGEMKTSCHQDSTGATKGKCQCSQPSPLQGSSQVAITSILGAGEETGVLTGVSSPMISTDLRAEGTPPPPLPPTITVSTQNSTPLVNGYTSDPSLPLQPQALLGCVMPHRHYKMAQPTHTATQHNVIKMPDHTGGPKGNTNSGSLPLVTPVLPHHHSFMPPPVGTIHHQSNNNGNNSNISTTVPGTNGGSNQFISQPPPPVDGSFQGISLHHYLLSAHAASQHHQQRGLVSTMASSPSVLTTTQSHQPGHSSPGCSDASVYSVSGGEVLSMSTTNNGQGEQHSSPPSHAPPHQKLNSVKAQSHVSGQLSNSPSPPLMPITSGKTAILPNGGNGNEQGALGIRGGASSGPYIVQPYYPAFWLPPQNGLQAHFYTQQAGVPNPQQHAHTSAIPNGMGPSIPNPAHDPFLRHVAPQFPAANQLPPNLYGNSVYPPHHNQSHHQHQPVNNSGGNSQQVRNSNSPAIPGSVSGGNIPLSKNFCYNCGHSGHLAVDCKESTMETMTKSYRLNFETKPDPK